MKVYYLPLLVMPMLAFAQTPPTHEQKFFEEQDLTVQDDLLTKSDDKTAIIMPISQGDKLEDVITRALIAKDWARLSVLLDDYRRKPVYDQILYDYALGAMYRSQGRYEEAIALYQGIAGDGEFLYPAFDLAVMLFEDKQYRAAEAQFAKVYDKMPSQMQAIITSYQNAIRQAERAKYRLGFNYEQTDNVNNAADAREFVIHGAKFTRDEASLPQSARGIRYDIGASKEQNITGNHFIIADVGVDGVAYWDNPSYDESTLAIRVGYANKDANSYWQITPFVEKNWLESDKYSRNYGILSTYSQRISPTMQLSTSLMHAQKRYEDTRTALRHDGHTNSIGITMAKQLNPNYVLYAGFDASKDNLNDLSESSKRTGIRLGIGYKDEKFGARLMTRYTKRDFLAENFWYDQVRHDREYQVKSSIWYRPWHYKGITPSLNYQYRKVDSNLDAMYARRSQEIFISLEKLF